jgi:hypothetical protein
VKTLRQNNSNDLSVTNTTNNMKMGKLIVADVKLNQQRRIHMNISRHVNTFSRNYSRFIEKHRDVRLAEG